MHHTLFFSSNYTILFFSSLFFLFFSLRPKINNTLYSLSFPSYSLSSFSIVTLLSLCLLFLSSRSLVFFLRYLFLLFFPFLSLLVFKPHSFHFACLHFHPHFFFLTSFSSARTTVSPRPFLSLHLSSSHKTLYSYSV